MKYIYVKSNTVYPKILGVWFQTTTISTSIKQASCEFLVSQWTQKWHLHDISLLSAIIWSSKKRKLCTVIQKYFINSSHHLSLQWVSYFLLKEGLKSEYYQRWNWANAVGIRTVTDTLTAALPQICFCKAEYLRSAA